MSGGERAYLFRHVLLRDAAYQLQMPRRRGELHALALAIQEERGGGPGAWEDMARHAGAAREALGDPSFAAKECDCLRRAAEHGDRVYDLPAALRCWRRLAGLLPGAARAEPLYRAGEASRLAGDISETAGLLEAALAAAPRDRALRSNVLRAQAALAYRTGRAREAESLARRAARSAGRTGDPATEALQLLGIILSATGRVREAAGVLRRAIAMAHRRRNRKLEGRSLVVLGHACSVMGRAKEARVALARAIRLLDAAGDLREAAAARANLGLHWSEAGDPRKAEAIWQVSLRMARESHNLRAEGLGYGNLANLYMDDGRFALAEETLHRAIALLSELGDQRSVAVYRGNLGRLMHLMGRDSEAVPLLEEGAGACRRLGDRGSEGALMGVLAAVHLRRGEVPPARAAWSRCRRALTRAGEPQTLRRQAEGVAAECDRAGIPPFAGTIVRRR